MSWKVYNTDNIVTVINTETLDTTKRSRGEFWYSYNNADAPIKYSIYQKMPEFPLVLNAEYTDFLKEDNSTFDNDTELWAYLDDVFNKPPSNDNLQSVKRGDDYYLKTIDQQGNVLLTDMLTELREMNIHLSLITGQNIKERKR